MKQCKCEHWEQCPICMPHRFDADGNRLPIPPTPLQACQAQIEALTAALFQAQEAAKALAKQPAAQCEKCKEWEAVCDQHLRHIKKLKKEKNT